MQIVFLGLNHRSAPVEVRERLALSSAELGDLLMELSQPAVPGPCPLAEAAIVSTCNRFEVYGLGREPTRAIDWIRSGVCACRKLMAGDLAPYLLYAEGQEAVRHLLAVAAGLDSMILGEPQILGQVVEACRVAQSCGAAGPVLSALLRQAIRCGKRARNETAISQHAVSVSHAAVQLARQIFGSLAERRVLLVGAGEMAELAARNLRDNGAGRILVVNRSLGRAQTLANRFGGLAFGWDQLSEALGQADVVICSAAAPHTIIRPEVIQAAEALRRRQPLFLVDIAVPRNVDAAVGKMPNVCLYDIDDLQMVVERNRAGRQGEVPRVAEIVEQCGSEFMSWYLSLDVVETIRDLRAVAERLRDEEVDRALRRLGPLPEREERVIRMLGRRIVSRLLHGPTVGLKRLAGEGNGCQAASAVRELYGLAASGTPAGEEQ